MKEGDHAVIECVVPEENRPRLHDVHVVLEKPLLIRDHVPSRARIDRFQLDGRPSDSTLRGIADTAAQHRVMTLSQSREPE